MQPLIIASLSIIGVLIGATLQYAYGQRFESRKLLISQKAIAYSDYFEAAAGLAQSMTPSLLTNAADAKMRICLFGSHDVILKLREFEQIGANVSGIDGKRAMAAVMNAMREDLLGNNYSANKNDLISVLLDPSPDGENKIGVLKPPQVMSARPFSRVHGRRGRYGQ